MDGSETVLLQGDIEVVSPANGANIGAIKRHTYDPVTSSMKNFASGYSSKQVPNLWDRSTEIRAGLN